MGLFNRKKENKELLINMPISGKVVKLENVEDEVFSAKMMGDGFAIDPNSGEILSPVDGEVVTLFPTFHAIGLKTKEGVEILIHFGMDTVKLSGEGFTAHIKQGDNVKAGDKLVSVNIDDVKGKVPSIVTPIIFTNLSDFKLEINEEVYGKEYKSGDSLIQLIKN